MRADHELALVFQLSLLRNQGMSVNHKRVARLLREDNLVGTERPQRLDDSARLRDHGEIYVNMANRLKLTGPKQVWVADVTFVRLKREFVYLAVLLDKFSRKVVGWSLARTITARLTLAALEMALRSEVQGLAWFAIQIEAHNTRTRTICVSYGITG